MDFENIGYVNLASNESSIGEKSRQSSSVKDIDALISKFPKTRFYGSKRRLLSWIHESVKDLPFNNVLDGFGGTASVSLLFRAMGKEVTYHDALQFNTIAAKALLANKPPFLDITEAHSFIDGITPRNGFISKTFSGMYYTEKENNWLDGAAIAIHQIPDSSLRPAYFYCLFQACLKKRPFNLFHRANLNLRLNANVSRSFGNLVTWEKPFAEHMKVSLTDLLEVSSQADHPATILPHGDIGKLHSGYDLVYLDPPYVSGLKNSDDYLKRYHFLEGLSSYADWEEKIDNASKTKSIQPCSYIQEWQSKLTFKERLFDLITAHSKSIVVLSYLARAYPTEEEITEYFKRNFRNVSVLRKDFCHAMAKEKKVELLFIGSNV